MNLQEIRAYLEPFNLKKVSEESGVKYGTLINIVSGVNTNPTYETFVKLSDYVNSKQVKS